MLPIARPSPACRLIVLAATLAWLVASPAQAHTLRPAIATVSFVDGGGFTLEIETNLEARLAGIGPAHADTRDAPTAARYERLRALPPEQLREELEAFLPAFVARLRPTVDDAPLDVDLLGVDIPPVGDLDLARKSVVRLGGSLPVGARAFRWHWPAEFGSAALRLRHGDGPVVTSHWLEDGEPSPPFALDATVVPSPWYVVAMEYLELGFTHILPLGLDHILFVIGLFLLSLRLAPILWQVTAFTLAHTLTLALSVYGVVSLPASIVEPLIALSIAYVGIENIVSRRLHPWRVAVVFAFGLLHGMGFAGVLTEIGLPERDYVTALVAFNVGVEFGQLAVILIGLLAVGAWRSRPWYRARIVVPGSAAIALTGLVWTVQRLS